MTALPTPVLPKEVEAALTFVYMAASAEGFARSNAYGLATAEPPGAAVLKTAACLDDLRRAILAFASSQGGARGGPTGCLIPGEARSPVDCAINGVRAAEKLLTNEAARLWDKERKFSGDLASTVSWGFTRAAEFLRDHEMGALALLDDHGDLGNTGGQYASPS